MANWFDNLPDDGGSFTPEGKQVFYNSGYFVSITNNTVNEVNQQVIDKLAQQAAAAGLDRFFLGYWLDQSTGKQYLDISLHTLSCKKALWLAAFYNQQVIYDCREGDCIYLEQSEGDDGITTTA
jgi:hypothetical protein